MGNAHPFYRFTPANLNGGFEPGMSIQSNLLNSFFNEYSDGDFIGDPIGQAIKNFQNNINLFNSSNNGGNLVLVYPKPYPAITGVQTLTFYVQSDQLYAVDSSQRVTIILSLNNGVITGSTFAFSGPASASSNYDDPILDIELLVKRALEIYYQNGSAIFPITYSFNKTSGIATSSIARAKDWIVDLDTGIVNRYPAQENPFAPVKSVEFSVLMPNQNYILSLMERIVSFTIADQTLTSTELIALVNGLHLPDNYSLTNTTDSSGLTERISILFTGERSFLLIGRTTGSFWEFQRFVIDDSTPSNTFLSDYAIGDTLPYEPLGDSQLFPGLWFDLDLVSFNNGCEPEDVDTFQMPIKTGDTYQFNIIPDKANLTGLTSCQIGLFDSELNFIQEIGTAQYPECLSDTNFTLTIEFGSFDSMLATIAGSSADSKFSGIDVDGNEIFEIIVPFADTDTGNINDYAQSIIDFINGLGPYTASYAIDPDLVFTIRVDDIFTTVVQINPVGILEAYAIPQAIVRCPCATQFQATVTIPFAPDGCYVFGLYSDQYPNQSIFAFSNSLELNNEDCFSSMWEFGSADDAIIEGFEYFQGWMQKMRLPINGGGQKPKIEESIYRNSDGTYQRPSNYSDLTLDLQSDYLDLETRNAVSSATRCPILIFEDQSIFVSGDLDVATVQDFSNKTSYRKLAQMKFSALIQGFQPDNNGCIGC